MNDSVVGGAHATAGVVPSALKYGADISKIHGCAGSLTAAFDEHAYRAVHQPITINDFLPAGRLNPARFAKKSDEEQCSSWGLSMYTSCEKIRQMILEVEKTSKYFRKIVGDHCAKLVLTASDGKRTQADSSGHFDFHEYESFDATKAVTQITTLFP
jgi:hypothetical protein